MSTHPESVNRHQGSEQHGGSATSGYRNLLPASVNVGQSGLMRILCAAIFALVLLVTIAPPVSAGSAADTKAIYTAIRTNDLNGLKSLVGSSESANSADATLTTPLMYAAEIGSLQAMELLIARGADVNAQNTLGITALMWSSSNVGKVRLLLSHNADPNKATQMGRTAMMMAAASSPSSEILKMLMAKGADAKAKDTFGGTALNVACLSDDMSAIRLLVEAGADVNGAGIDHGAAPGGTPLMNAAANGNLEAVNYLLKMGAKANAVTTSVPAFNVKSGAIALGSYSALSMAAPCAPAGLVKVLIDAGADVNQKDIRGMTPLMLAVATDAQNPATIKILLDHGANASARNNDDETAADWARKVGSPVAMGALGVRPRENRPYKSGSAAPSVRTAIERSLALVEPAASEFNEVGGCVGCHAQIATSFAVAAARAKGIKTDDRLSRERVEQMTAGYSFQNAGILPAQRIAAGGVPEINVWILEALARENYAPDAVTDLAVSDLLVHQRPEGNWRMNGTRTPLFDGDFTRTALALRALKHYAPPALSSEAKARIERAKQWLLHATPVATEDRNMQLVGLSSAGASVDVLRRLASEISAQQHADGGWSQRQELGSDAYATATTLWALAESGVVKPGDEVYRKGVGYLLSTQHEDGSWFVASRAVRFQPYFEGGFPYADDQWISSMATAWATNALALALPEK